MSALRAVVSVSCLGSRIYLSKSSCCIHSQLTTPTHPPSRRTHARYWSGVLGGNPRKAVRALRHGGGGDNDGKEACRVCSFHPLGGSAHLLETRVLMGIGGVQGVRVQTHVFARGAAGWTLPRCTRSVVSADVPKGNKRQPRRVIEPAKYVEKCTNMC